MDRGQTHAAALLDLPDVEQRFRRRRVNIQVAQAKHFYAFYAAHAGADDLTLEAPDAADVNISSRRWKWLCRQYDLALKAFYRVKSEGHVQAKDLGAGDPKFFEAGECLETPRVALVFEDGGGIGPQPAARGEVQAPFGRCF